MNARHKVGIKARSGRHRSPPEHKSHHKPAEYSRVGRLLKQRMALLFAPKISDFDLDWPRLGMSELEATTRLRPNTGELTAATCEPPVNRASAAPAASPQTRKVGS
jgi:hypothetical protein